MSLPSDRTLLLAQALPEAHLRELVENFRLEELLDDEGTRREYFNLVRGSRQSTRRFLGFPPPPSVIANSLAPSIAFRSDYRRHVRKHGGADKLADRDEAFQLALAAAGAAVAAYFEETAHDA